MDRLKALIREPALLIDAFESLVVVLVALGLFGISGDQQTNLIALFIAVLAVGKGVLTHPFPVTVLPDFGRAALVFCVSMNILNWTPDQVTLVATFLGTLMTVVQRAQITPRYDSIVRAGGAGAGPVAGTREPNDRGAAEYETVIRLAAGILILLGVLDLILLIVGSAFMSVPLAVIFIVCGVVVLFFTGRGRIA